MVAINKEELGKASEEIGMSTEELEALVLRLTAKAA